MASVVASYQGSAFTTPTNGTPDDADQVRGNDNTLRSSLNGHDADAGVHFQSSALASRPTAGSLGRKWITSDAFRIYYDDGSNWQEIAYAPLVSPTFSGTITHAGSITTTGNLSLVATGVGASTISASGSLGLTTANGNLSLFAGGGSLLLSTSGANVISLSTASTVRWTVNAAGHLLGPAAENLDIGTLGATRPRAIFAAAGIDAGTTFSIASLVVVRTRQTGWAAATNTKLRTTFDTTTVTLPNLAARVGALIDDLTTHGLIGP